MRINKKLLEFHKRDNSGSFSVMLEMSLGIYRIL